MNINIDMKYLKSFLEDHIDRKQKRKINIENVNEDNFYVSNQETNLISEEHIVRHMAQKDQPKSQNIEFNNLDTFSNSLDNEKKIIINKNSKLPNDQEQLNFKSQTESTKNKDYKNFKDIFSNVLNELATNKSKNIKTDKITNMENKTEMNPKKVDVFETEKSNDNKNSAFIVNDIQYKNDETISKTSLKIFQSENVIKNEPISFISEKFLMHDKLNEKIESQNQSSFILYADNSEFVEGSDFHDPLKLQPYINELPDIKHDVDEIKQPIDSQYFESDNSFTKKDGSAHNSDLYDENKISEKQISISFEDVHQIDKIEEPKYINIPCIQENTNDKVINLFENSIDKNKSNKSEDDYSPELNQKNKNVNSNSTEIDSELINKMIEDLDNFFTNKNLPPTNILFSSSDSDDKSTTICDANTNINFDINSQTYKVKEYQKSNFTKINTDAVYIRNRITLKNHVIPEFNKIQIFQGTKQILSSDQINVLGFINQQTRKAEKIPADEVIPHPISIETNTFKFPRKKIRHILN
ncbi:hypothetical protein EDEG_01496 [Edhazardia aedis USNM 41457]|uniref:Uncharacterized protein n=1 Tax=Edhazardia aedis (strain USNM 41457) TaxID=1003232 RepID=J9DNU7_EDHAE|nr:hypothetical protein EDEG_01496 [Edhazardia aedis USNM 41457]|eukprot:EJW04215.1 hypothetical protein EDEG_01496 [Edhazardia aedis USNM 41457]